MIHSRVHPFVRLAAILALGSGACVAQQMPQPTHLTRLELDQTHFMLRKAYDEVKKNYYDPKYHGVDIEAMFQKTNKLIDNAPSLNEAFRIVQAFLATLHDSHLYFVPPEREKKSTPGYSLEIIGDKCFVTRIRPGTDAATKLHLGDQVVVLDGYRITPAGLYNLLYYVRGLSNPPEEHLVVITPEGEQKQVTVVATRRAARPSGNLTEAGADYYHYVLENEEQEHRGRARYAEFGDTMIWKMSSFEIEPESLNGAIRQAAKHKNLILDLRGNGGGYVDTLKELLSHFYDHDVKLGDRVTRKGTKPEVVKPAAPLITANVTVLIDHDSASASEVFARVLQLDHRATIMGDHSDGAVMESQYFDEADGADTQILYGFIVTVANIIMTDGKSLEGVGVSPDERMLPTAEDLADQADQVLAHAASLYGVKLDPIAAGKLFPYEWARL